MLLLSNTLKVSFHSKAACIYIT